MEEKFLTENAQEQQTETPQPPQEVCQSLTKTESQWTQREDFRETLRNVLLDVRRLHLAAGGNPFHHWDRIQAVMVSQAQQTASVREWLGRVLRRLQIQSPDSWLSSTFSVLVEKMKALPTVQASEQDRFVLSILVEEMSYLIAMAQQRAKEMKEAYSVY